MSWDNSWEDVFKEQEWGKYPAEGLIRFTARNFYQRQRDKVKILEVGCGTGANIWYFAREGFDVYGVDGSKTAIKRAKQRIKEEGLKAKLATLDIERLPYPDAHFDAVIDNECLTHNSTKDTKIILGQIKRVLKKNGLFYSRTFTNKMYIGRSQTKLGNLEFTNVSDGHFAVIRFIRLTSRAGIRKLYAKLFNVISVDKLEYTNNNGSWKVNEWIIICQKR